MKATIKLVLVLVLSLAMFAGTPTLEAAEPAWPSNSINIVIGFTAGGPTDVMLQAVRPGLEKAFGQALVPVYKAGSGGDIAWTIVAKAKPDGYNIAAINSPNILGNIQDRETAYKLEDFQFIANVMTDPNVILVNGESPIKTLDDLIKAAHAKPGLLTIGTAGVPGDDWFSIQMLNESAKTSFKVVPFKGDGPSMQALLGKHIDVCVNNMNLVLPQLKAGKLRCLAVFSEKRYITLPNIPTAAELGHKVIMGSSRGFGGPKALPKAIVDKFANAVKGVMESADFKSMEEKIGFPSDFRDPANYTAFLHEQNKAVIEMMQAYKK